MCIDLDRRHFLKGSGLAILGSPLLSADRCPRREVEQVQDEASDPRGVRRRRAQQGDHRDPGQRAEPDAHRGERHRRAQRQRHEQRPLRRDDDAVHRQHRVPRHPRERTRPEPDAVRVHAQGARAAGRDRLALDVGRRAAAQPRLQPAQGLRREVRREPHRRGGRVQHRVPQGDRVVRQAERARTRRRRRRSPSCARR